MQRKKRKKPKKVACCMRNRPFLYLIFQVFSQFVLRPVQGTANGAFLHTAFRGDLRNGLLLEIVGDDGLPLEFGEFILNHLLHPL